MNNYIKYIPITLLCSYLIFLSFVAINVAHSIIFLSLVVLTAYQQYLSKLEQPNLEKEIADLRSYLDNQISQTKEHNNASVKRMEDEVSKVALAASRIPSSFSSKKDRPNITF